MKNIVLKIFSLLMIFLLSFTLLSCDENEEEEIKVDEVFTIHTELQTTYLAGNYKLVLSYATGKEELSRPLPITLKWELVSGVNTYIVHLSENSDFSNEKVLEASENQIDIYNLKINTVYYWYVICNEEKTVTKTFKIDATGPRNLYVDGITNVRDIGGYKTESGKYVKQGMIYRTARLNENESTSLIITPDGIKEMLDILKVKSELDVRKVDEAGITSSPLGDSVNYFHVPMTSGGNYLLINKDVIKDVFKVLGNEENYPIFVHCSIGTDRTGVVCFLVNALLGVSEEDLYRDYLFSNFGYIEGTRTYSAIEKYIQTINSKSGDTLSAKTENYLLSIGVSASDIQTVKKMMLS